MFPAAALRHDEGASGREGDDAFPALEGQNSEQREFRESSPVTR